MATGSCSVRGETTKETSARLVAGSAAIDLVETKKPESRHSMVRSQRGSHQFPKPRYRGWVGNLFTYFALTLQFHKLLFP